MNVKFRFSKPLLWGSILLLMLVVAGCSLPMDPVDPASDPSPSKKTEESSEQSSAKQSSEEDPDDEDEEQDSDDGEDDSEDENGEDEEQDSGDGQNGPEGGGGEDEEQTPGEEQDDGPEDVGGKDEGQTPAEEQNGPEGGGGEDEEQTPGEEQDDGPEGGGGEDEGQTPGEGQDDGPEGGGGKDEEQTPAEGQDDGPEGGGGKDEGRTPAEEQNGPEGGGGEDEGQTPGEEQDNNREDENEDIQALGNLVIRIGKMGKPEEGVYPDLGGITRYRLDFFGEDGKTAESLYLEADGELTATLDTGEWEIHAYGLLTGGTGQTPVIHGTARATVYAGGTENVLIVPDGPAAETEEQGFLSWNIDYPGEKVWEAGLTVFLRIDEHNFIPYRYFDLTASGTREQKTSLPAGTYKMESHFLSHTASTGSTEIVHIYPGLETRSSRVTIAGNLFPNAVEFSSVEELKTYLAGQPENTEAAPYPVKIAGVDLSSKEKTGETLKTLYDVLSRYVTLDLSGCTGTNLISASALAGRKKIVSLILPDSTTSIASNGFAGYEALKSVVLSKINTIDYAAFHDLENLEMISAPELTDLADSTNSNSSSKGIFYKCTALKSIYFPKLQTLGHHAFYGCTALTEVLLPKTAGVGPSVFAECTALKTVVLPEAIFIGNRAFYNDKSLENLVLGSVPPQLEGSSHFSSGFPQKLWVPASAIEDYQNSAVWTNMKNRIYPITG
ncbi:MAG: leucine-rich repeat protein [Treponema sp.]|nr:leucine-rich repeat protein [Treponema sp.]